MNSPKDQPIDEQEQRAWIEEHRSDTKLSWRQLASRLQGINHTSLSLWVKSNYNGPGARFAEAIYRYRQTLISQAALKSDRPEAPTFFETETSKDLCSLLNQAQGGRIVYAALGAGLGKTKAARHFQECNSNVFLVTVAPSTAGLFNLQKEVLFALGFKTARGSTQTLSRQIKDHVRNLPNALLILDEAQHLLVSSIEEVRSWHDETGMGIALFGNEQVQQTLDGGTRSAAFAQIFSRVGGCCVRSRPLAADVEALLEAWGVTEEKACAEVHRIAQLPGALRSATFVLELAHMVAAYEKEDLQAKHVELAWTQLSQRNRAL